MKVSIIIPAHNEEKYIGNAIKACLEQNYNDFEIIVVDNASSDKTAEIAKSFGVKVLTETRKGTGWARECGRLEAKGEIIANLDSDCVPDKDWIKKGIKHFSNKKISAVSGPYDYYDGNKFLRIFSIYFQSYIYVFSNWLLQKLGKGAIIIGGNVFLRADYLEKVGGYNTDLVFYGDDTDTAKKMIKTGRVIFDTDLITMSSARRLKSKGYFKTWTIYIYYFFKTIFS